MFCTQRTSDRGVMEYTRTCGRVESTCYHVAEQQMLRPPTAVAHSMTSYRAVRPVVGRNKREKAQEASQHSRFDWATVFSHFFPLVKLRFFRQIFGNGPVRLTEVHLYYFYLFLFMRWPDWCYGHHSDITIRFFEQILGTGPVRLVDVHLHSFSLFLFMSWPQWCLGYHSDIALHWRARKKATVTKNTEHVWG